MMHSYKAISCSLGNVRCCWQKTTALETMADYKKITSAKGEQNRLTYYKIIWDPEVLRRNEQNTTLNTDAYVIEFNQNLN